VPRHADLRSHKRPREWAICASTDRDRGLGPLRAGVEGLFASFAVAWFDARLRGVVGGSLKIVSGAGCMVSGVVAAKS
jgi:hypothetical protein